MDAKQVLDNWKARHEHECSQDELYDATKAYADGLEETVEALKTVIWEALNTLENDQFATRAYNAAEILRNGLAEFGEPDYNGDDPYGASNG